MSSDITEYRRMYVCNKNVIIGKDTGLRSVCSRNLVCERLEWASQKRSMYQCVCSNLNVFGVSGCDDYGPAASASQSNTCR